MRISHEMLSSLSIHFIIISEKDIIIFAKVGRYCDNLLNINIKHILLTC